MLPHSRKEAKFDSKSQIAALNELSELYNCNNCMFFEARKGQDLYMHVSAVPNGSCVKMLVQNSRWPKFWPKTLCKQWSITDGSVCY